jgi:cytochrome c-type biogenesis protein CcmE
VNPRRKKRMFTIVSLLTGLSLAVALTLISINENIDIFYTPTELIEGKGENKQKPFIGQKLRIGGMVVPGSVVRDETTLDVEFKLIDTGPLVTVRYQGILPDLFREGQGIIAQGILEQGNVIQAFEVLAKHDEEYMPADVAEAVKGIKHVKPEYSLKENGY